MSLLLPILLPENCRSLDELLGGGVETLSLTEVFGEFRAGKTQFCHTLCVTCQMPIESGGGGGKIIYIDTEGTFRPERVAEIARLVLVLDLPNRFDCCTIRVSINALTHFCSARGLDDTEVLDNVLYARLTNSTQQIKMIPKIAAIIASDDMFGQISLNDAKAIVFGVPHLQQNLSCLTVVIQALQIGDY